MLIHEIYYSTTQFLFTHKNTKYNEFVQKKAHNKDKKKGYSEKIK